MKTSNQRQGKNNEIDLIIEKIENGEAVTPMEVKKLKQFFRLARREINYAVKTNEKEGVFSKRKSRTSAIFKYAGIKIVVDQLESIVKAIFQE